MRSIKDRVKEDILGEILDSENARNDVFDATSYESAPIIEAMEEAIGVITFAPFTSSGIYNALASQLSKIWAMPPSTSSMQTSASLQSEAIAMTRHMYEHMTQYNLFNPSYNATKKGK